MTSVLRSRIAMPAPCAGRPSKASASPAANPAPASDPGEPLGLTVDRIGKHATHLAEGRAVLLVEGRTHEPLRRAVGRAVFGQVSAARRRFGEADQRYALFARAS